jgi:hypothetical protein
VIVELARVGPVPFATAQVTVYVAVAVPTPESPREMLAVLPLEETLFAVVPAVLEIVQV